MLGFLLDQAPSLTWGCGSVRTGDVCALHASLLPEVCDNAQAQMLLRVWRGQICKRRCALQALQLDTRPA